MFYSVILKIIWIFKNLKFSAHFKGGSQKSTAAYEGGGGGQKTSFFSVRTIWMAP